MVFPPQQLLYEGLVRQYGLSNHIKGLCVNMVFPPQQLLCERLVRQYGLSNYIKGLSVNIVFPPQQLLCEGLWPFHDPTQQLLYEDLAINIVSLNAATTISGLWPLPTQQLLYAANMAFP
jgi:hypothetical protein